MVNVAGLKEGRRRPGMVRMGRGETTTPAVLPWHMDAVAERYAEQDSNTLKAAGKLACPLFIDKAISVIISVQAWFAQLCKG